MEFTVFIPTRGRVGLETQITLRDMKKYSSIKPWIVCADEEVRRHQYYYPHVMVSPIEGIAQKRQWIIENSPTRGIIMLDDDLYFSYRPAPHIPRPLERIVNLDPMFGWMSDQLDAGFIHGGISARQGNQNVEREFIDCTRCMNVHFIDRDLFLATGIKYDTIQVMEDFFVTLSLLTRGFPNRVGYQWCWNQRGGGTKGGCSLYRTPQVQSDAADALYELFPEYVTVVEKVSESQTGVMANRKDVNVRWLKAWEEEGKEAHSVLKTHGVNVADPDTSRK